MAQVIGPNGVETYVPDHVARSLVGNGSRGYAYAPERKAHEGEAPQAAPRKRLARRSTKSDNE